MRLLTPARKTPGPGKTRPQQRSTLQPRKKFVLFRTRRKPFLNHTREGLKTSSVEVLGTLWLQKALGGQNQWGGRGESESSSSSWDFEKKGESMPD